MRDRLSSKVRKPWPEPDRWQVILSALGVLVAVTALVVQVGR